VARWFSTGSQSGGQECAQLPGGGLVKKDGGGTGALARGGPGLGNLYGFRARFHATS